MDVPYLIISRKMSHLNPVQPHTSGRKMLPAIPQELSDTILDFLHDDVTALCSAGLVCRSWLPASRLHLFSDIELNPRISGHRGLLEAICAERSTIPPYIRYLDIEGHESQFVDETLLRLPLLSNLKSLELSLIIMANLIPDAKKRLITLVPNLTALYFNSFDVCNCFSLYPDSFCLTCNIGTV